MSIYGHLLNELSLMPVYSAAYIESTINELQSESFTFDSIMEECDVILNEKVDIKQLKDKAISAVKAIIEKIKKFIEFLKDKIVSIFKNKKDKHKGKDLNKDIKELEDKSDKSTNESLDIVSEVKVSVGVVSEFLDSEIEVMDYKNAGKTLAILLNDEDKIVEWANKFSNDNEHKDAKEFLNFIICNGKSFDDKEKIKVKDFIKEYGNFDTVTSRILNVDDKVVNKTIQSLSNSIAKYNEIISEINSTPVDKEDITMDDLLSIDKKGNDDKRIYNNAVKVATGKLNIISSAYSMYLTIFNNYTSNFDNIEKWIQSHENK